MASYSFPFPTNGTDNEVTAEMVRDFNASCFSNGVLEDFVLSSSNGSVLVFSAGKCIIDGAFFSVGDGVTLDLNSHSESSLYIVVRMDVTSRSCYMAAVAQTSDINGLRDLVIGTANLGTSNYSFTLNSAVPMSSTFISDGAVTADKIANNAITTPKLVNGAITSDKLAGQIPMSKLTNKVHGSFLSTVSISSASSGDFIVPLPSGWTKVLNLVAIPTTAKTRVILLSDGVNRTVRCYNDDTVAKSLGISYILFGY